MAIKQLVLALTVIAATAPLSATNAFQTEKTTAPTGSADTRYCLRVEAVTGSRVERIQCWTRTAWAEEGVDVDQDWAREGVRTIG